MQNKLPPLVQIASATYSFPSHSLLYLLRSEAGISPDCPPGTDHCFEYGKDS